MAAASEVTVGGRRLKLTNLDKVLYPKAGFTKGEVIDYYARVGPAMVPASARQAPDPAALPERRRGAVVLREARAQAPARLGEDRDGRIRPRGRDRLHAVRQPGDADLARAASGAGAAPVALEGQEHGEPDRRRLRPRPRAAGGRNRLLPGCAAAPTSVRRAGAEMLPQDVRLEGIAGLRPAERRAHRLRPDPALRPRCGAPAREGGSRPGGVPDDQGTAHGQGVRRLEPEQPQQDDGGRLLAPRPRAPDRSTPLEWGRGGASVEAR